MYDNRHSKNTYASSTMATDGSSVYAFFESGGLYAFDFDGKLAVEEIARRDRQSGNGAGNLAGDLREPVHPAVRSGNGRRIVHRRARSQGRDRGLAAGAEDPPQLGDTPHRAHAGASGNGDFWRRGRDFLRSKDRQRAVAREWNREPSRFPARSPAMGSYFCLRGAPANARWP